MADQLQPTSAADFRRRSTFVAKIDSTLTVELKRADMMTMIMNDAMPMPLLDAAMKFEETIKKNAEERREKGLPALTELEQYAQVDKELMAGMLNAMRQYAIIHAVKPRIVPEGVDEPDTIPVTMLTPTQLLSIFYASPEGEEREAPVMDKNEAVEFRRKPEGVPSNPGPSSPEVRRDTKLLDLPQREYISA